MTMNKFSTGRWLWFACTLLIASCSYKNPSASIKVKNLPKPNPTSYVFSFPLNEVEKAHREHQYDLLPRWGAGNSEFTAESAVYLKDDRIMVQGKFIAKPADFKVKIPKMVIAKIAENVDVDYNFILQK